MSNRPLNSKDIRYIIDCMKTHGFVTAEQLGTVFKRGGIGKSGDITRVSSKVEDLEKQLIKVQSLCEALALKASMVDKEHNKPVDTKDIKSPDVVEHQEEYQEESDEDEFVVSLQKQQRKPRRH